jgi:hypothetical protein
MGVPRVWCVIVLRVGECYYAEGGWGFSDFGVHISAINTGLFDDCWSVLNHLLAQL